jgi:hypothetical protein
LWMNDHGGELPAGLGDLVPGYLEAVPQDPLASTDGAALGYEAAPRARIVGVRARPQDRMEVWVGGK